MSTAAQGQVKKYSLGLVPRALTVGEIADLGLKPYTLSDPASRDVAATSGESPGVDLRTRSGMPTVYDQGGLGSCMAQALCGAVAISLYQGDRGPSTLYEYYQTRALMGQVELDEGSTTYHALLALKNGVCPTLIWPYVERRCKKQPRRGRSARVNCYFQAKTCRLVEATTLAHTVEDITRALDEGRPVVITFPVYDSFYSLSETFVISMPTEDELKRAAKAGHAVVIVGYRPLERLFIVRNSWGKAYADNGHVMFPYDFVTTYAWDLICLTDIFVEQ